MTLPVRQHLATFLTDRAQAFCAWLRHVFAVAVVLSALVATPEFAGDRDRVPETPAPYGPECRCALEAAPPALAVRSAASESWKPTLQDLAAAPASSASGIGPANASAGQHGAFAGARTATLARGYDANAPPIPLA